MNRSDDLPADRIKELRARLGFDDEPSEPQGEALLVWQFFPMEAGLPGWRPEKVRRLDIEGRPPVTRSAWRPGDEQDVALMLDTYECADSADARDWLLRVLAGVQSTAYGRMQDEMPGDLAFGMPEGGAMVFARANLVCQLRNGDRTIRPVNEPARSLDRWVAEPPQEGGRMPPELVRVQAGAAEGGAEGVTIQLEARDPADRPVWFRLSAPSGGLSIVDGLPRYQPERDAAPATITVAAIGPGGASIGTIEPGSGPGQQRGA